VYNVLQIIIFPSERVTPTLPVTPSSIGVLLRDNMVAIRLLLTTTSIVAFSYGGISRIIRHRVTHSSITRLTMESSTPNEKTESEVAKQALSDYIVSIRSKMLSYSHHPELTVIDNNSCMKISLNSGSLSYRGLIWDKSIYKYSVEIDASSFMIIYIGFAPSKLFDVSTSNFISCGWYLYLYSGSLYSQNGDYEKAYCSGCKVGDTITCIYDSYTRQITFEKNGVSLGVAFTNVNGEDIAPAVELYHKRDSITFLSSL
jgi:SPRY domain